MVFCYQFLVKPHCSGIQTTDAMAFSTSTWTQNTMVLAAAPLAVTIVTGDFGAAGILSILGSPIPLCGIHGISPQPLLNLKVQPFYCLDLPRVKVGVPYIYIAWNMTAATVVGKN